MNRIAIFAHYDRDAVVDEYVLYYLRGLREVASRILFVSDSPLPSNEIVKLEGLAECVSASRHGEYDFGSWKRGLARLGAEIDRCDELVLANDSCYAPVFPFAEAFDRMATIDCDAWSGTATGDGDKVKHLNSYFSVYRRCVLADRAFRDFWPMVTPQPSHDEVVRQYENRLSEILAERGYRLRSLVPPNPLPLVLHGDYVRRLAALRAPWLKVQLFRDNPLRVPSLGAALPEIDGHYPRALIDAHLRRIIGTDDPPHYHFRLGTFRRRWRKLHVVGRTRRDRWWKVQVRLYGVRVLAFGLPLRPRR
jgi:lipopolysaccharide biosynthesis protein